VPVPSEEREVSFKKAIPETVGQEVVRGRSKRDLYCVLFRNKWKVLLLSLAIFLGVTVLTLVSAEVYRSEAKLLVRLGRESVTLDPTVATGQVVNVSRSRDSEMNSELEVLSSQELLQRLIDVFGAEELLRPRAQKKEQEESEGRNALLGIAMKVAGGMRYAKRKFHNLLESLELQKSLSDHENAILELSKSLHIERLKDSSVIKITYDAKTPEMAQQVTAKLIDLYLEKHIAVHKTPGSYEFFRKQTDELRKKLQESERELLNTKPVTSLALLEEQRRLLVGRASSLEDQMEEAETTLASSRAKVAVSRDILTKTPKTWVEKRVGFANLAADSMAGRLYALRIKEQALLTDYSEESEFVETIRRQIETAEGLLKNEDSSRTQLTTRPNAAFQELRLATEHEVLSVSALEARVALLRQNLEDAQTKLRALDPEIEKVMRSLRAEEVSTSRLHREMSILEASYRKYSDNLEQARVHSALETRNMSNISVVQRPTLPAVPIRPRKLLNLSVGLLLALLGSVGLAFLSDYLDHSIRTPEEAEERLQLPALASIPNSGRRPSISIAQWNGHAGLNGTAKTAAAWKNAYGAFRERLLLPTNCVGKPPHVIAITSCRRGEGVSTVAANLAAAVALDGNGSVLLVDADAEHHSLDRLLKVKQEPGLADLLSKGKRIIRSSPIRNLHVLPSGRMNGNGNLSGILNSGRFTALLESARKHYRLVVIDAPVVNELSSTGRLARLCDGVILVVETERMRWEVVQSAKEQLAKLNANIVGVVLNKRRFPVPRWLYRTL